MSVHLSVADYVRSAGIGSTASGTNSAVIFPAIKQTVTTTRLVTEGTHLNYIESKFSLGSSATGKNSVNFIGKNIKIMVILTLYSLISFLSETQENARLQFNIDIFCGNHFYLTLIRSSSHLKLCFILDIAFNFQF